ncbi:phage tail length tape measure family protein [Methylocystis suflitae]|uniref:phage tail length tape measure family protein n=1 Tax=Methylocystis suflitae TaxID=2951405 RepID=UPI00210DD242|nr:phage tail length tape measure family protein [Methylocystis suflitae]MCQ4188119.1 phage tail length tape measure family protein [Methylocystis suflitae]
MAGKSAVTLRLGVEGDEKIQAALRQIGKTGDEAMQGLSREAKEAARSFDRLEKGLDVSARSAAQFARTYVAANNAVAAGVRTQADAQRVLDLAAERHRRLTGAVNDNAKAAGLARHEWVNLSRQFQDIGVSLAGGQSPLTVLFQQGSQVADIFGSSGAGAGAALRSFGAGAVRALTSPIGIAVQLTAAVAGIEVAALKAESALAKIGETAKLSGLSAEQIQGAKIVGAGVGLDEKSAVGAFANASQQFEQFARNEGAVKSALEHIDAGFLKVADRARTAGEFIDIIERKIRDLPRAEGLNLAQSLFGDDAGRKLFDAIESGAASMGKLAEATGRTGDHLDQAARAAHEAQLQIDRAAAIASDKLLKAFQDLGDPVTSIKLGWYEIVGSIAQAVSESENLQAIMRGFLHPIDTVRELVTGETPFKGRLIPLSDAGIVQPEAAGASRGRFVARAEAAKAANRRSSGKSPEQRAADKFTDIETDLQGKIALASVAAEGAEHDKIALKIKIENEQRRIGVGATQQQKDEVAALVTQLEAAESAQKAATKEAEAWRDKMREVGDIARDVFSSVVSDLNLTNKEGINFKSTLDLIDRKLMDIASRTLSDSLFGGKDKGDGLLGGLIKGGASALGGIFGGGKSTGYFSGGALFSNSPFHFADGGIMTSAGPLPLRRYAAGGVADSPQLAMFGEGRQPEAFVPLPDGRSIPVAMRGNEQKVIIQNFAPGIDVQQQVTPQGVVLTVQSMLKDYSKQIPGILSDAQRRGNR